jgi:hypothetical protein
MKLRLNSRFALIGLTAIAGGLSGCAVSNPLLSYGPEPRVEDCALIRQATPSQYVCGNKTYTAVQLADIRNGKPPETK